MKVYPKDRKEPNYHLDRRWVVDYQNMIYDGGGTSSWSQGFRTYIMARISAWYHYNLGSWGGKIDITDTKEKPMKTLVVDRNGVPVTFQHTDLDYEVIGDTLYVYKDSRVTKYDSGQWSGVKFE